MWTVGLTQTGNLLGLSESEVHALSSVKLSAANQRIAARLHQAGAHYVIDGIWDLPGILERINRSLALGEHP
jgi:phosphonoacetaldehyde hydrolase